MKINSIELNDFRNYEKQKISFNAVKNIIVGKNAQGKTNLLEAIYLLCLSKSFRTSYEKEAIKFASDQFILKGEFELDSGITKKVVLLCSQNNGKQLSVNRKRINRVSEFIGSLPIVISSPEEYNLTNGPPAERRKFVDILLSQINRKYINHLMEYQKIIKHKNALLLKWKQTGKRDKTVIDAWNDRLIIIGSKIIEIRNQFSKLLSDKLAKIYSALILNNETLAFFYQPNIEVKNSDNIEEKFADKLNQICSKEFQRGISLIGPHRDDFVFRINDSDIKKFGSRGQHKTVLISLAIAEYQLIEELTQEKPIILIDDLYSELDREREEKIIAAVEKMGQIFITATEAHKNSHKNFPNEYFIINEGKAQE